MGLYATAMGSIEEYLGLSPAAFFTIAALMVVVYNMVCGMFVSPEEFNKANNNKKSDQPKQQEQEQEQEQQQRQLQGHEQQQHMPMMGGPPPPTEVQEPVQMGDMTEEELKAYDGSDPNKPLLMAIKGQIYDVSPSRLFYGPGGPYAFFAGKDPSRALALLSFDPKDLHGNLEGLSESELEVLQDWEYKFVEKYVKVGQLVTHKTAAT